MQRLRNSALVIILAILLVSCGLGEEKSGEIWKEEVRLQTGELIVVGREFRWGGGW